jgi:hypothetical protein
MLVMIGFKAFSRLSFGFCSFLLLPSDGERAVGEDNGSRGKTFHTMRCSFFPNIDAVFISVSCGLFVSVLRPVAKTDAPVLAAQLFLHAFQAVGLVKRGRRGAPMRGCWRTLSSHNKSVLRCQCSVGDAQMKNERIVVRKQQNKTENKKKGSLFQCETLVLVLSPR